MVLEALSQSVVRQHTHPDLVRLDVHSQHCSSLEKCVFVHGSDPGVVVGVARAVAGRREGVVLSRVIEVVVFVVFVFFVVCTATARTSQSFKGGIIEIY